MSCSLRRSLCSRWTAWLYSTALIARLLQGPKYQPTASPMSGNQQHGMRCCALTSSNNRSQHTPRQAHAGIQPSFVICQQHSCYSNVALCSVYRPSQNRRAARNLKIGILTKAPTVLMGRCWGLSASNWDGLDSARGLLSKPKHIEESPEPIGQHSVSRNNKKESLSKNEYSIIIITYPLTLLPDVAKLQLSADYNDPFRAFLNSQRRAAQLPAVEGVLLWTKKTPHTFLAMCQELVSAAQVCKASAAHVSIKWDVFYLATSEYQPCTTQVNCRLVPATD